ncbi:PP2C family protein-serine/threonine phosphatase [Metamycoplasma neophronis]|uniref:Serine/threonine-protein phosphatase n=1 Tax=Metamycoplasma neophronis TaxID=872983 RepID=A0ABY2Z0P6_9BACT|nr:protein phosphatase 2C domain-containing protein [Metamycoplasma neophronis]TPR54726.1 serine/threonine-protein phosphatase [Metamycoplasma neophronis]
MNFCIKSDIGNFRKENQDRAGIISKGNWTLAMLCDGMGGHFGGSKCAQITVDTLKQYFEQSFPEEMQDLDRSNINKWFNNALSFIKKALVNCTEKEPIYRDMGTTLTAALVFNLTKSVYIFNIGDSRTYIYNGLLHLVTRDQNFLHQLINIHNWKPEEARKHPDANKLVSCLGPNKTMQSDGFFIKGQASVKYILLTSDGVHDFIEKPQIELILQNRKMTLEEKCDKLITIAKKNLSRDNLTVELVEL